MRRDSRTLADVSTPSASSQLGRRPFRGSSAIAAGLLTRNDLRSGCWRRLLHDVYIAASVPDSQRLWIQAAMLRLPAAGLITGRSAAYLWGAQLADLGDPVEVLSPTRLRSTSDLVVHTGTIEPAETAERFGVTVPTPLHVAWDMAQRLSIWEAVPWIDALSRAQRLATADLLAHAAEHVGHYGSAKALNTLSRCDGRAESPPESTLRLGLVLGGVPPPIPQWRVIADGEFVARVDLAWPWLKLAVEYDGQWHADRNQLARDRVRIRNLNAAGWYIYPVTRNDMRDLDRTVRAIAALVTKRSEIL